jgi:cobalt/nickel transport system permease protein
MPDLRRFALEDLSRGSGPFHALDPRAKLAGCLWMLAVISTTPMGAHTMFAGYAAILLGALLASGLPLWRLAERSLAILPFSLVFAAGSWWAGDRARALGLVEKSILSIFVVLWLMGTTPLPALLEALRRWHAPRLLLLVTQFVYRYLFLLSGEAHRMRLAADCRSGKRSPRALRFRVAAAALGVLFARSYRRAENIHRAMLARGYRGHLPVLGELRFRAADAAFLAVSMLPPLAVRLAL